VPSDSQKLLPDFIILGAMKCGTSTMAAQLGAQPGIFMTDPKEPNFFSDDPVHAKGISWYNSLFANAAPSDLKGEASTHYTKLPTFPKTMERMVKVLDAPKLIYMIREPVSRTVSHYIHEWTMGGIIKDIDSALNTHPELIAYGCYARQIAPYVEQYGADSVFVTSLEAMNHAPEETLQRICRFIGFDGVPEWIQEQALTNVSSERIRRFPLHSLLIENPVAETFRRTLVPQALRDRIKRSRQMRKRPVPSAENMARMHETFSADRKELHRLFPNRTDLDLCYPFAVS